MKKNILVFASLLLSLFYLTAQAQVSNDNTINMQAILVQGWGRISYETASGGSNPTFIGKIANDTDGNGTLLLNTAYSTSHTVILNSGVAKIANPPTLTDEWGPVYNSSMGVITGSTSNRFDFSVMSWETDFYRSDGQARYQLINCGEDYCTDDNPGWDYWIRTPKSYVSSSEWYTQERTINNGSKYKMKFAWRYTNGTYASTALNFGTLSNTFLTHVNSNKGAPSGGNGNLGYVNAWSSSSNSNFEDITDVTYTFTLDRAKNVEISTDWSTTDFDSKIHIVKLLNNATSYQMIASDDNGGTSYSLTSKLTRQLCPGTYGIIVEGNNTGNFLLSINPSDVLPNSGTIAASSASLITSKSICPNTAIGTLYGWVAGTAVCGGSLNYQWQKSTNNGGWTNISGATSGTLFSTGNIGGSTSVRFRRAVS